MFKWWFLVSGPRTQCTAVKWTSLILLSMAPLILEKAAYLPSCCLALHKTMWHELSLNPNERIIELFNKGPEVYFLLGQKRTKETWSMPGFIFIFILLPRLYHQKLCCLLLANPSIKWFMSQKYCTNQKVLICWAQWRCIHVCNICSHLI